MRWPTTNWFIWSLLVVGAITLVRLIGLAYSQADIFVDEAQYWFWGQNLDLGYFSKPPLAAWIIRATTELAGSNAPFWLRFPAPIFHGATAILLGALAARLFEARAAFWVAVSYATLPIVAVGSVLISTDTILAPFFAAGLLFYFRLVDTGWARDAVLAGTMVGLAVMAKYAGAYFLIGAVLSALIIPRFRISPSNAALFLLTILIVISPNIWWNLNHDLTTVQHTLENVDWAQNSGPNIGAGLIAMGVFLGTQLLAVGPVIFVTLFVLVVGAKDPQTRALVLFSLPIVLLVATQALLSSANANWAFTAYLAGVLAAVPWLLHHGHRALFVGLALNVAISVLVPVLSVTGDRFAVFGKQPVLVRYMGRVDFSRQIIDLSRANGDIEIVSGSRDVLADLFYTGIDQDIRVSAAPSKKPPRHYYQQNFSFRAGQGEPVLYVTDRKNVRCKKKAVDPIVRFDTAQGAYFAKNFAAYIIQPGCFAALR